MHPFTVLFAALLIAGLALRLWLLGRQIRAVAASRDRVPAEFSGAISGAQHAKAADYTIALAGLSRLHAVFDAGLLSLLTIGGGIAWMDSAIAGSALSGLVQGIAVIAATAFLLMILDLPFSAWRTFRIESRFGLQPYDPRAFCLGPPQGPRDLRGDTRPAGGTASLAVRARGRRLVVVGVVGLGRHSHC